MKRHPTADEIAEGVALVGRVAERLRVVQAEADERAEDAALAVRLNAEAHTMLSAWVGTYRHLLAALAGGGGYERVPTLVEAIREVHEAFGDTDDEEDAL